MNRISFTTELIKVRNAVRLCVPDDLSSGLGTARLLPARITINGHSVRTTLHKMGGGYMTAVNKAVQQQVGATAGDTVNVTIEPDTEEPRVDPPEDLADALARSGVRDAFDRLSAFRQREMVTSVTSAIKAETRVRRISRAVEQLSETESETATPEPPHV